MCVCMLTSVCMYVCMYVYGRYLSDESELLSAGGLSFGCLGACRVAAADHLEADSTLDW
jgi:hypothetical protein